MNQFSDIIESREEYEPVMNGKYHCSNLKLHYNFIAQELQKYIYQPDNQESNKQHVNFIKQIVP